jgi:hypothetical protein
MAKKYLWISVCRFQRVKPTANSMNRGWEQGLAIGNGIEVVNLILDSDGKPLDKPPYNYELESAEGCFLHGMEE